MSLLKSLVSALASKESGRAWATARRATLRMSYTRIEDSLMLEWMFRAASSLVNSPISWWIGLCGTSCRCGVEARMNAAQMKCPRIYSRLANYWPIYRSAPATTTFMVFGIEPETGCRLYSIHTHTHTLMHSHITFICGSSSNVHKRKCKCMWICLYVHTYVILVPRDPCAVGLLLLFSAIKIKLLNY